jgi:hypothetical protein
MVLYVVIFTISLIIPGGRSVESQIAFHVLGHFQRSQLRSA